MKRLCDLSKEEVILKFNEWVCGLSNNEMSVHFPDCKDINKDSLINLPSWCKYNILFNNKVK